jgi:hypothetical protein
MDHLTVPFRLTEIRLAAAKDLAQGALLFQTAARSTGIYHLIRAEYQ